MFKKINTITETITKTLKLPLWHKSEIKCEKDQDACCHDAFFPFEEKFCCINYKKREVELKYAYISK